MGSKPLCIRFFKIDEFIKIYDGIKYLLLLSCTRFDKSCDNIRYLISKKSGITGIINHNSAKIRKYSYSYLPIEKILTFHNAIILIKSVINKNKNHYYYNTFFKKGLYKDKSEYKYRIYV